MDWVRAPLMRLALWVLPIEMPQSDWPLFAVASDPEALDYGNSLGLSARLVWYRQWIGRGHPARLSSGAGWGEWL